MAQTRPGGPYIWATALAKLFTGENSCEWAGWFRAHHQGWTKPPSDFDSATWMLEHTALVNRERESLERIGYDVYTENQNLLPPPRRHRHHRRQTGPHRREAPRDPHLRRQDRPSQPVLPSPGPDLPVRGAQGPPAVPGQRRPRPGEVPQRLRRQPRLDSNPRVHRQHGRANQETRGRHASPPGSQRHRVPALRHQQGGLPGQNRRRLRPPGNDRRLLDMSGTLRPLIRTKETYANEPIRIASVESH